jgi:hypothetical protein
MLILNRQVTGIREKMGMREINKRPKRPAGTVVSHVSAKSSERLFMAISLLFIGVRHIRKEHIDNRI